MKTVFALLILTLSGGSRFFGSFLYAQNYPDQYWVIGDYSPGAGIALFEFISKDSVILSPKIEGRNDQFIVFPPESDLTFPDSNGPNTYLGRARLIIPHYSYSVLPHPLKRDQSSKKIHIEPFSNQSVTLQSLSSSISCGQGRLGLPSPIESNVYMILTYSECSSHSAFESRAIYTNKLKIREGQEAEILEKDVLLLQDTTWQTTFTESMFAVKHADGISWWILARQTQNNKWMIFKYDANGIRLHRTASAGETLDDPYISNYAFGDFSPDGTQLAFTLGNGQTDVFDFDRCEGTLTLTKKIAPHKKITFFSIRNILGNPKNNFSYIIFAQKGNKLFWSSVMDNFNENGIHDCKIWEASLNQNSFQLKPKELIDFPQENLGKMLRNPFDYSKIYIQSSGYNDRNTPPVPRLIEIATDPNSDSVIYSGEARLRYLGDDISSIKNLSVFSAALYPNYRLGAQTLKEATRAGRWGDTLYLCGNDSVGLGVMPKKFVRYEWFPSDGLSSDTIANPTFYPERTGKKDSLFHFVLTAKGLPYSCWDGETMIDTVWVKIIPRNQSPCTYTSKDVLPNMEKVNPISVYPNPASDEINIKFNPNIYSGLQLEIYSITGVQLQNSFITGGEESVKTDGFTDGVYLCKFSDANGNLVQTQKLIIRK